MRVARRSSSRSLVVARLGGSDRRSVRSAEVTGGIRCNDARLSTSRSLVVAIRGRRNVSAQSCRPERGSRVMRRAACLVGGERGIIHARLLGIGVIRIGVVHSSVSGASRKRVQHGRVHGVQEIFRARLGLSAVVLLHDSGRLGSGVPGRSLVIAVRRDTGEMGGSLGVVRSGRLVIIGLIGVSEVGRGGDEDGNVDGGGGDEKASSGASDSRHGGVAEDNGLSVGMRARRNGRVGGVVEIGVGEVRRRRCVSL